MFLYEELKCTSDIRKVTSFDSFLYSSPMSFFLTFFLRLKKELSLTRKDFIACNSANYLWNSSLMSCLLTQQ